MNAEIAVLVLEGTRGFSAHACHFRKQMSILTDHMNKLRSIRKLQGQNVIFDTWESKQGGNNKKCRQRYFQSNQHKEFFLSALACARWHPSSSLSAAAWPGTTQ
jgi:hypothetical protein